MRGTPWSETDLAKLALLRDLGKSTEEIAALMPGRSASAIRTIVSNRNMARKPRHKPLARWPRQRIGIRMGSLVDEIDAETQDRIVARAAREGCTVARAIGLMLRERE